MHQHEVGAAAEPRVAEWLRRSAPPLRFQYYSSSDLAGADNIFSVQTFLKQPDVATTTCNVRKKKKKRTEMISVKL